MPNNPAATEILKRAIPSSGELLPVVGLGTWSRFDTGASENERAPLQEVVQRLHQLGGSLIDSSPMYGRSESVVGELTAASGIAERFFYATKVWTSGKEDGIRQMETSMQRMRRTQMDLMQIHNLVDWKTHLSTLNQWKEEGRIRYTGITHYTVASHEQLEQLIRREQFDFVQFNYSIRVRHAELRLLKAAQEKGVAVIINEPLEKGSLFGLVKGKALPAWAAEHDIHNWTQFFLKYILAHPAVTCIIPATAKPENLSANMSAGYGRLPNEKTRLEMIRFLDKL